MANAEQQIYVAAVMLFLAAAALVAGFWSGIIQSIHGGYIFFFALLGYVVAIMAGTVCLMAFALHTRPSRRAVIVAVLPFTTLVGVLAFGVLRFAMS